MSRLEPQRLPARAAIRIGGAEACAFLHNLLTADIAGLSPGGATYAALLTPQGKILFDLFVLHDGDGYLIDCSAAQRDELARRLTFYKLRAKVTIDADAQFDVGVASEPLASGLVYADPRTAEIGYRCFADSGTLPEMGSYDAARIPLGLADSDADLGQGTFFPHEANLDQCGAVSFTKGCYVGQEVVSRMEHRGTARSRILPVRLSAPATAGEAFGHEGIAAGTLLSTSGRDGLAIIRLDRLAEAPSLMLTNGVSVSVRKPRWVRYDVPGAKDV
jgi:hypothetical protein